MKVIFLLVKTFEFRIQSENQIVRGRCELFQQADSKNEFRFVAYEAEMFRLQPTFPQDSDGKPEHTSDEVILVERSFPGGHLKAKEFSADSLNEAVKVVLAEIEGFESHLLER